MQFPKTQTLWRPCKKIRAMLDAQSRLILDGVVFKNDYFARASEDEQIEGLAKFEQASHSVDVHCFELQYKLRMSKTHSHVSSLGNHAPLEPFLYSKSQIVSTNFKAKSSRFWFQKRPIMKNSRSIRNCRVKTWLNA